MKRAYFPRCKDFTKASGQLEEGISFHASPLWPSVSPNDAEGNEERKNTGIIHEYVRAQRNTKILKFHY